MASRILSSVLVAIGVVAVSTPAIPAATGPVIVPVKIVESLGHLRPTVEARFNDHPMPMMIHSNASFFAQIKHKQAASFGVAKTGGHRNYGIDRGGHVSGLGLDHGVAAKLDVGGHIVRNAAVSIFEVPQDEYGMLGIGWIRANRVIVDYRTRRAIIAPTDRDATTIGDGLLRDGYAAVPMGYDATLDRYVVRASIKGVERRMTIATASSFTIDSAFAEAAKIRHGADKGHGSGPTGTHVAEYALAEPVRVTIGDWTSPAVATGDVTDEYGYIDAPRPADPAAAEGGSLGGSFLIATEAVVDFGRSLLFVRNGRR